MDFYSRRIIDWAYGTAMTAELALTAIKNACLNVRDTEGIILQRDLGTQYTSDLFEGYLSYSRKGCPYDNVCIESLHSFSRRKK